MLLVGDPVQAGLVSSLTHPGGNVTGTSLMHPDVSGKRVELLREIVPKLRRVAILWNPRNASAATEMRATETATRSLGLTVYPVGVDTVSRLDAALADMVSRRPDGLLVMEDALMFSLQRPPRTRCAEPESAPDGRRGISGGCRACWLGDRDGGLALASHLADARSCRLPNGSGVCTW